VIARLAGSFWVRAGLSIAVLGALARHVDLHATGVALARLDPVLGLGVLGLVAADRTVMIWRWVVLLRARNAPVSAVDAARIYLVSSFVGSSTALAGDAARAYSLARRTEQGSEALASVAVDRLLGMVGIVSVALAGVATAGARHSQQTGVVFLLSASVLTAFLAVTLTADVWIRRVVPARSHTGALGRRALRLADSLGAYRGHRGALLAVAVLSTGVQLLRILQAYLLGLAIGIVVPFSYYLLFMPAGLVALMLPISIGGFGAPQGLIVWLLQPRGVPAADALALSTLIVISGLLANLPGAVLMMGRGAAAPAR
jgi:uncharacterized protein (TIRG00374 family)